MKSSLGAVKRQWFPARASRQVQGLFILGLGSVCAKIKPAQFHLKCSCGFSLRGN